jgi:hypothetical protein
MEETSPCLPPASKSVLLDSSHNNDKYADSMDDNEASRITLLDRRSLQTYVLSSALIRRLDSRILQPICTNLELDCVLSDDHANTLIDRLTIDGFDYIEEIDKEITKNQLHIVRFATKIRIKEPYHSPHIFLIVML